MRLVLALLCATAFAAPAVDAQTSKTTPKKSTPASKLPPAPLSRIQAEWKCSSELGVGVATARRFCDVLTGADPKEGPVPARVPLPSERGAAHPRTRARARASAPAAEAERECGGRDAGVPRGDAAGGGAGVAR